MNNHELRRKFHDYSDAIMRDEMSPQSGPSRMASLVEDNMKGNHVDFVRSVPLTNSALHNAV